MTDDLGRKLHDRRTRGEAISVEEQVLLEQWYAQKDQEESVLLRGSSSPDFAVLQAQIDAARPSGIRARIPSDRIS